MGAAEKVTEAPRVVEVKGTAKPPLGIPYYGLSTREGLKPVFIRTDRVRQGRENAIHDSLEWYEKPMVDSDGIATSLIYHIRTTPIVPPQFSGLKYALPLFPDCMYPVAVWNITRAAFDEVDNRPFWTLKNVLDENMSLMGANGVQFKAFHFVVMNHNYIPKEIRPGLTDDGNWTIDKPVAGYWIIEKLTAEQKFGRDPLQYPKRINSDG